MEIMEPLKQKKSQRKMNKAQGTCGKPSSGPTCTLLKSQKKREREKEERMTKISSDLIRDVVAHTVKNLPAVRETWVQSLVRKIP